MNGSGCDRGLPGSLSSPISLKATNSTTATHAAALIPDCMIQVQKNERSRGPVQDLWDDGLTLVAAEPPDQPVKVSYILLTVVGLLSLEWLCRKLLLLA